MTKSKDESKALAVTGVLPENQWQLMRTQMQEILDSGFLPESIKTVEQAVAVVLTGRELGLQPMESLRSINIIKGKPTLSAELLTGLALRHVPGAKVEVVETTATGATVNAQRPDGKAQTFTFNEEDARRAKLLGKTSWQLYPAHMYRWRALSAACKAVFPDAVLGLYTPEELGAEVDEEGKVVEVLAPDTSLEDEQQRNPEPETHHHDDEGEPAEAVEVEVVDPEPPVDDKRLVNPAKAKELEARLAALNDEPTAWALRKMVTGGYKAVEAFTKEEAKRLAKALDDNPPPKEKVEPGKEYHEGDPCGNTTCLGKLMLKPAGTSKKTGREYKAFLSCSEWQNGCTFKADAPKE